MRTLNEVLNQLNVSPTIHIPDNDAFLARLTKARQTQPEEEDVCLIQAEVVDEDEEESEDYSWIEELEDAEVLLNRCLRVLKTIDAVSVQIWEGDLIDNVTLGAISHIIPDVESFLAQINGGQEEEEEEKSAEIDEKTQFLSAQIGAICAVCRESDCNNADHLKWECTKCAGQWTDEDDMNPLFKHICEGMTK